MRFALVVFTLVAALCSGRVAHADLASVSAQGQLALQGSDGFQLDSEGVGLGYRVSAQVLFLEAYYDYLHLAEDTSVARTMLNFSSGLEALGLEVAFRAGLGAISERGGALDGGAALPDRNGVTARAGGALELPFAFGLRAGVSLDSDFYVIKPSGQSFSDGDTDTGVTTTGMLYLKLKFGI